MEYTVFKVEKKENYAIITFNRPDKFNAANAAIFTELAAAVKEMDADPDVGCMILTGQTFIHPKKGTPFPVFSAGADVEQFASVGEVEARFRVHQTLFRALQGHRICRDTDHRRR